MISFVERDAAIQADIASRAAFASVATPVYTVRAASCPQVGLESAFWVKLSPVSLAFFLFLSIVSVHGPLV